MRRRHSQSGQVTVSHLILLAAVAIATTGGMRGLGRGMGNAIADAGGASKTSMLVSHQAALVEISREALIAANRVPASVVHMADSPIARSGAGALLSQGMHTFSAKVATGHGWTSGDLAEAFAYLQHSFGNQRIGRILDADAAAADQLGNALLAYGLTDEAGAFHRLVDLHDARRQLRELEGLDLEGQPNGVEWVRKPGTRGPDDKGVVRSRTATKDSIATGGARPGEAQGRIQSLEDLLQTTATGTEALAAWVRDQPQGARIFGTLNPAKTARYAGETARRLNAIAAQGELTEDIATRLAKATTDFRARVAPLNAEMKARLEELTVTAPSEWTERVARTVN